VRAGKNLGRTLPSTTDQKKVEVDSVRAAVTALI
jgi:hypothetical protein